jgi:hypothetical protein
MNLRLQIVALFAVQREVHAGGFLGLVHAEARDKAGDLQRYQTADDGEANAN